MVEGYYHPLSPVRRMINECLHHTRNVPLLSTGRVIQIPDLVQLRSEISPSITWTPLFLKAAASPVPSQFIFSAPASSF